MKKSKQEFSTQTNYRSLKQFSSILMCGLVLSGAMLPSTTALADTQSSSSSHAKTPSLVTSSAANTVDNMVSEAKITSPAISGELMINYVDANGVKIKTSDSYLGYVGDAVDLSSYESSFKGYTFSVYDVSGTVLSTSHGFIYLLLTTRPFYWGGGIWGSERLNTLCKVARL